MGGWLPVIWPFLSNIYTGLCKRACSDGQIRLMFARRWKSSGIPSSSSCLEEFLNLPWHHTRLTGKEQQARVVGGNLLLAGTYDRHRHRSGHQWQDTVYRRRWRILLQPGPYDDPVKRAGKLANLAGLIVGQFTDMKDNANPGFGKYEIVEEHIAEYVASIFRLVTWPTTAPSA